MNRTPSFQHHTEHRFRQSRDFSRRGLYGLALALLLTAQTVAQDHTVAFETEAEGEYKGLDLWGLDTAWLWDANVIRGVNFMGKPQTDVIRFSFTGDTPIVDGELTGSGIDEFNERMRIVDTYTKPETVLYLNNDTENWDSNPYLNGSGVDPLRWAELIAVTARKAEEAGRAVISVAPFNEPDHGTWQGDISRFGDVSWRLRWSGNFPAFSYSVPPEQFISIMGGNTLNNDQAANWYNQLNDWGYLEEGNTHQLAGSFDTYAAFYQTVEANGDVATNDELHNVMEAMVGAEYGMDVGIWWGTAERARGEFVKASDGMRLAYAEDRPNWTAASVYRAPDGKIQGFVGESERQADQTTYRFFSKDRPVFFDGHGPQRFFDVTTTGGPGYQTSSHKNAERVVNITWGDDVQPVIDGRYYLVNRASLQVMEIARGSADAGANIEQSNYAATPEQLWDVNPVPRDIGGDNSYVSLVNVNSGMAPDIWNWSLEDGGNIAQWNTSEYPSSNQQYFLEYVEDGWFSIGSRWSGLYLAGNGSNVEQQANTGSYAQQWRLVPADADPTDFAAPGKPKGVKAIANAASVTIKWKPNSDSDIDSYTVLRSTTNGGPYEIVARELTGNAFTDNSATESTPYHYTVQALDKSGNRSASSGQTSATPTGDPALVARYDFQLDAADASINGNHAYLNPGARFSPGGLDGSCLALDGGSVSLPSDVASHDQLTIATWINWSGGASWQRIFDFGNGAEQYLFLTPANWDGQTMQFTIFDDGVAEELYTAAPAVGEWTHVAVVIGDGELQLYVNGTLADSKSATLKPSDFDPVINYIGKSQFPDPLFKGAIDDFRIYNYALSQPDLADLASATPSELPPVAEIYLENADFEAGVGSWPEFDGFDNPDHDVPGWTNYSITDAGVEAGNAWWGTYEGSFSAFMAPGNAAYLLSEDTIEEGDEFELSFVAKTWSGGSSEWTATLFYDDPANVIGSYVITTTGDWTEYSSTLAATSESVGGKLGILFTNTGDSFANIDDVAIRRIVEEGPPSALLTVDTETLSPPNHKIRDVQIKVSFFDPSLDPQAAGLNVSCYVVSNEPDNGNGDGHTTGDVNGYDGYTSPVPMNLTFDGTSLVGTIQLRAERSGYGTGRVYTIVCDLVDGSGNARATSAEVIVPHD
ncbi:LamG-like jellyroll fold domain-containing protein [Pelagicoccus sp. SDUM812003]|uniref:LamG-like jellyroll fold domain-containing protein n=1 Tax=Pelagicoccus sp. SDUM812003 TaxID=3041267 RepID=UPI00280CB45D|nr:LamG-like jellyroll fold domain-containing protein [Pelagicoccus sp. SDUM812003]MDQ8205675.1 RICIN domain-containing protein [Pelagicoccus sp. SDUM812003]